MQNINKKPSPQVKRRVENEPGRRGHPSSARSDRGSACSVIGRAGSRCRCRRAMFGVCQLCWAILLNPHSNFQDAYTITISNFQMRTLKLRSFKWASYICMVIKWWSCESNPSSLIPEIMFVTPAFDQGLVVKTGSSSASQTVALFPTSTHSPSFFSSLPLSLSFLSFSPLLLKVTGHS